MNLFLSIVTLVITSVANAHSGTSTPDTERFDPFPTLEEILRIQETHASKAKALLETRDAMELAKAEVKSKLEGIRLVKKDQINCDTRGFGSLRRFALAEGLHPQDQPSTNDIGRRRIIEELRNDLLIRRQGGIYLGDLAVAGLKEKYGEEKARVFSVSRQLTEWIHERERRLSAHPSPIDALERQLELDLERETLEAIQLMETEGKETYRKRFEAAARLLMFRLLGLGDTPADRNDLPNDIGDLFHETRILLAGIEKDRLFMDAELLKEFVDGLALEPRTWIEASRVAYAFIGNPIARETFGEYRRGFYAIGEEMTWADWKAILEADENWEIFLSKVDWD